jgi:hypothetical protein
MYYYLVCVETKKKLCIGFKERLFTEDNTLLEMVECFLNDHKNKTLHFVDENILGVMGKYTEYHPDLNSRIGSIRSSLSDMIFAFLDYHRLLEGDTLALHMKTKEGIGYEIKVKQE